MNTLTQKLNFRQSVILFSQRNSVSSAVRKFGVSRATIYRWRKMYDGTLESLTEHSRRPHHHPISIVAQKTKRGMRETRLKGLHAAGPLNYGYESY